MDISATQIYEDDDFSFTQKISHDLEEESVQVGTLSIDSTNYQIKTGTTKIGRHSSCDIVINDATVSKVHAEIEASEGQASTWISDLNSSNKTKLNKLILRPTRLYELKEGSVIEFGRVRATYRTYCPADNTVIPETPAPPRQKVASVIIPNTPDSSLNNSSGVDDDGFIILGTQKDDEDRIFRRPRISQCQSTSIDKKNTPMNKNNNSRNTILHTTDLNVRENQVSIFDAETQKFEEGHKTASKSIHDVETQGILTDVSEHLVEANATTGKQLSELNICDKTTGRSVIDIHDIETQNYVDDINEIETQKSKSNIHIVTGKKLTADIHIMKIQDYVGDTDESGSDTQKSEIGKNNDRKKNLAELGRDIHDLETQKFDDKYIAEDISDLETQLELNNIAKCEQRDISDMETQFVTDGMAIETSNNRADKYKDKDRIANTTKDAVNRENITKSPKSRSNSPGSLNLSSPGIEDCPSSPLNQSGHLLESTCLLEFFGEDIDKQENMQASNASTKPPTKVSTERNSNVENVRNTANNEENNDEDIFEAPTQRESHKFEALMSDDSEVDEKDVPVTYKVSKKKRGTPRLEQTNDDSETDAEEYIAELAIKQRESSGTSNKLSNNEEINNRNDPSTSIESEDMFDVLTQRLDNPTTKDTLNALINQSKKTNEINRAVNDMESTEISNNYDQDSRTSIEQTDINDAPTQLFLLRETSPKTVINSKDIAAKNNQNNVDGMATTHVINAKSVECCTTENLDSENIDYELAPTQVIGEIENKEKRTSNRENDSSQVNLNDTLEQRLNEMFDNVNNDTNNIHELPLMSTQILEDILQSSQCDDSTNKSITEVHNRGTNSVQRKQLRRKNVSPCNQYSDNLADTEVNADNISTAETDSQNSDTYFSTITTRRKRNILKDTQEFVEDIALCQNVDSLRTSKANNKEDTDDNKDMEFNERRKRVSKKKNKSDPMKTLNDNNRNKAISSENNEINNERSFRNLPRQKDKASEASKQVLGRNQTKFKVDDAEENISISTPCSSAAEQCVKTLDTLYESDDDILMRLPVVRISGTFSNPASPSASSTSTVRSTKSIRDIAKSKKKKPIDLRGKSLRKRDVGNSEKNNKSSADSHPNSITSPIVKISGLVDTSEDSETDSETKYKFQRFQQMADRMLGNKPRYLKRQDKGNSKNTHVSSDISDIPEDPKQNTDVESKSSTRTSSRMIRNKRSSKQSDKSSRDIQKETREKNKVYGDRSTKTEIKSIVAKRMVSSNMVEENTEQITLKKRKTAQVTEEYPVATRGRRNIMKTATDRQSPNILKYFTKMNSRESSPIIEKNTKSSEDNKTISKTALEKTHETSLSTETDGNADSERSNVKRSRRIINRQVTTHISDVTVSEISKKNKPALTKGTEVQVSQSQEKVLRVVLNPIKNLSDNESQEIERIMAKGPSNAQDKNSSIRESSKAKIFQRKLRTRSRKRSNSDIETDSVLIESTSSGIGDSDNTQFNNTVPTTKRKRFAKNSVSSLSEADVSQKKEETFKKPSRVKNSKNLTLDSSENTLSESSQESTESDASTSSRVSRSKAASIRKKEKLELNQDTHKLINESASRLNTSVEITSLSTSSRTRRSTSLLSNSTLSAMKHKVLFTGITEDYSKIVKTLGGSKVEDPAKCTILVIDKVRRTYKFLCTLAKGIPIVAIDWLRDSEAAERFLDWENYILKDPAAEAKFGFRLRKSLDKAKEKKLLDGYTVVLTPNVAPPPVEELKNMVLSCGGKALLRPPTKWPERAIVLSREEDMANARKFLAKAPKTITVQSTEFILTGILRQETDFNKYKLM